MTTKLDQVLLEHIKELLQPLLGLSDEEGLPDLLDAVSWDGTALGITDPTAFTAVVRPLSDAVGSLDTLLEKDEIGIVELAESLAPLAEAIVQIKNLISSLPLPPGSPADTLTIIGKDILDFLIDSYLASRYPKLSLVLQFLGIFSVVEIPEIRDNNGNVLRASTQRRRLDIGAISQAVSDPLGYIRQRYLADGAGNQRLADAIADLIGPELAFGLRETGLTGGYGYVSADLTPDEAESAKRILIIDAPIPTGNDTAPALLRLVLALSDEANGLGVVAALSDDLAVNIDTPAGHITGELSGALEPLLITKDSVTFASAGIGGAVQFKAGVGFQTDPAAAPALRFGSADSTRFEIGELQAGVSLSSDSQGVDAGGSIDLKEILLAIQGDDGDGFLRSVLPANGLQAKFDLGIVWSNERGLTFLGAAGLDATLPVSISIGGVLTVPTVHLGLQASDASLLAEVSASVGLSIGPVHALVDRIGITTTLTFPKNGGNLGVADLALGFKSPSGVGLALDSQVVVGGGYLRFDPQTEEYSGFLQLEVAETIAVKGFGLITTRLPDGSKGFSMLILISAEGFAPIQLGFGFTLTGVGGLLGVNRTVMVDVLRGGIKNGTLGSILFPKDPIRNAPQIVSDLRTVFPPVADRYLFGPMAIISWGTPTILTLEIALILEIPEPIRLIILGRLRAILPEEKEVLVQVRMDAIGIIDFNKGEVSLDATLYDSRILEFTLTGDMALRANWGDEPNFVLAIGGFNPRFAAPAGFPQLDRLALSLSEGDELRLRCESYFALTSNTVQFGARLDLHAAGGGFTLDGYLGFDALFHFSPFAFVVDIGAGVALRYHGHLLMGIYLEGVFSGPTPWHVRGKATFKVLFFKVSVSIDHRFGGDEPAPLPEAVDVLTLLVAALSDARNWSGELPQGEHPLVSFRQESGASTLRAHPLAELTVRQRVVPLNMTIDTFGNAPLSGSNRFTLAALRADGSAGELPLAATMMQESFALGQFQQISDDEMLSRPSFESRDAGIRFGTDEVAYRYDPLVDAEIEYETLMAVPGQDQVGGSPPPVYVMSASALDSVVATGAAGQAAIRRTGNARYRTTELVV